VYTFLITAVLILVLPAGRAFGQQQTAAQWEIEKVAYGFPTKVSSCSQGSDHECYDYVIQEVEIRSGPKLKSKRSLHGSGIPRWSPDGQTITAIGSEGLCSTCLVIWNSNGSGRRVLRWDWVSNSVWSPNGTKIAYVADRGHGSRVIATINPDGSAIREIQQLRCSVDDALDWSPDGKEIAFTGCVSGNQPLVMIVAENDEGSRMLCTGRHPLWSPDGKQLLFLRDSTGRHPVTSIWVVDADGRGARKLLDNEPAEVGLTWAPSQNSIFFSSTRHNKKHKSEIFRLNADGTGLQKIFPVKKDSRSYGYPIVSPDGREMEVLGSYGLVCQLVAGEPNCNLFLIDLTTHRSRRLWKGIDVSIFWQRK